MTLAVLLLLGADEVRPRWDREDCDIEPGECLGLDVLQNCKLGPGLRFCFGIEEVDEKPAPRVPEIHIHAPCGVDAAAWAAPRLPSIQANYPSARLVYGACDKARPRIDVKP